jgi:gamma-glutamylcyclotransferase (GGCT)/AIG2-like uncharacterized protein YtfP
MDSEYLFSYGTLQLEKVQLESFGRKLEGNLDIFPSYKLEQVKITDESVLAKSGTDYHPIAIKTDSKEDQIEGMLFLISTEELKQADLYAVAAYKRIKMTFRSGIEGWVYVSAQQ